MKNKKELEQFRKTLRKTSIENGVLLLLKRVNFTRECFNDVISKYVEKVVVVSHTEKSRNICDKVKITLDPNVINRYLYQDFCRVPRVWGEDVISILEEKHDVLKRKSETINLGLIIETKISDLDVSKKEQMENEEEEQFFFLVRWGTEKNRYKIIDRRHLSKVLEEQKLSSSGLTESETVKLGKLLNLDIIVLRLIYENNRVTKVLKVDTGEVLLFKTYETEKEEKKTEKGWVYYGTSYEGDYYYDNQSIEYVTSNVIKIWNQEKYSKKGKDEWIKMGKKTDMGWKDWKKLYNRISLWEFQCVDRTSKLLKYVLYDSEGNILLSYDYPFPSIDPIPPNSINELLLRKVCPK